MKIKDLFLTSKAFRWGCLCGGLILFGLLPTLLYYFLYSSTFTALSDVTLAVFIVYFTIGSFIILVNFGTFDIISYGMSNIFANFGKKDVQRKYADVIDYRDKKADKRKANKFLFIPWYIASFVYLIVCIITFILYKNI